MAHNSPSEEEFCPSQEQCFLAFFRLLPRGAAWGTLEHSLERDTVIKKFWYAVAGTWSTFETAICNALDQFFCSFANTDIDRWELDYGVPDECDIYNINVCQKATARGRPSAEYLVDLLAQNGYIGEGRWLKGNDIEYPGVRSTFRIVIDTELSPALLLLTQLNFSLGLGYTLGSAAVSRLQCMLERYIPAHTVVETEFAGSFDPETDLAGKLVAWWHADDTTNGEVLSWEDRIGGLILTASAGTGPTSALHSGIRTVDFNGVDEMLIAGTITFPAGFPTAATNGTLAISFRADALVGANQTIFGYGSSSSVNQLRGFRLSTSGTGLKYRPVFLQSLVDAETYALPFHGTGIARYTDTGDLLYGRINGRITNPENVAATPATPTSGRVRMGNSLLDASTDWFNGGIRSLMIFNTSLLTVDEEIKLEGWHAHDAGKKEILPSDHPYRNLRP